MQIALAMGKCEMHYPGMRSHSDIIRDGGGAQVVHDKLGFTDKLHTVRSWVQRDSIPGEHWKGFADVDLATLDELAAAAATRRELTPADSQAART